MFIYFHPVKKYLTKQYDLKTKKLWKISCLILDKFLLILTFKFRMFGVSEMDQQIKALTLKA